MFNGNFHIPIPQNETVLSYAPGSPERAQLKATLQEMIDNPIEVPSIIGGQEVTSGKTTKMRCPHDHSLDLGVYHQADEAHADKAIGAANKAKKDWSQMPWSDRAA